MPNAFGQILRLGPTVWNVTTHAGGTMNSSSIKLATAFQVPPGPSRTITRVVVRPGASVARAVIARLQGVDGSGNPDGTTKGSGGCSVALTGIAGNTASIHALDNSYVAAGGEWLSIVIEDNAGSNTTNMTYAAPASCDASIMSYGLVFNGTSWSKAGLGGIGWGTSTELFCNAAFNAFAASATFRSDQTISERGMAFTVPDWIGTAEVAGVGINYNWLGGITAGTAIELRLYSGREASDTTVAYSNSIDSDILMPDKGMLHVFAENTGPIIQGGNDYRIALAPGSVGTWQLTTMTFSDNALKDSYPLPNATVSRRGSATSDLWEDETGVTMPWFLVLRSIDKPVGSGTNFYTVGM